MDIAGWLAVTIQNATLTLSAQFIGIIRSMESFRVTEISFLQIGDAATVVTLRDRWRGEEGHGEPQRILRVCLQP